ncbi:PucR family transcriptional regulator [Flexivirga alba]|uniref:PucR family transcriptional regulator n=1 Tax=Flexivirga alba TaxID=702742 RepID=A0ABW2AJD3_9MICO
MSIGHIVYVLFPSVRDLQMPHRLAKGAATALEARLGYPVLVASSTPECGIDQLPALRREVDDVLDVQSGHPNAHGVATARDVYAELLLRRLGAEITSDDRNQHPGVRILLEHDSAHGTAYRETLCAYFAALGDIGVAAGALRLHPNTVRYRIRRAEDLFGLKLDDADETLVIWLAIRVAQN